MSRSARERIMHGVTAVLFDFDGTLVDASDAICHAFNAALRKRGRRQLPDSVIRSMIGRPLREMFSIADHAASSSDIDASVEAYRSAFFPMSLPLSRPLPGAQDTVSRLAATMKLAIVTSRMSEGAMHILRGHGLLNYFSTVVGIERVEQPKPSPEPVLRALKELGVEPERAVMVGDTSDDMSSGKAAGVKTIGVTTGTGRRSQLVQAGADRVIDKLAELPAILNGRPLRVSERRPSRTG